MMTYKDYALIPLDRSTYFSFSHSTWDILRQWARDGGKVSLRTIYSCNEMDYYRTLEDLNPNADWDKMNSYLKNNPSLIFEASREDRIVAIGIGSFFNSDPMLGMYIENEEGKDLRAIYAIIYEAINFAKHNLKAPFLKIRYRIADAEIIDSFNRVY